MKNLFDRNRCFRVLNKLLELFLQVMFSCMGGDESAETSNNDVGKLISRLKPMSGVVTAGQAVKPHLMNGGKRICRD